MVQAAELMPPGQFHLTLLPLRFGHEVWDSRVVFPLAERLRRLMLYKLSKRNFILLITSTGLLRSESCSSRSWPGHRRQNK